MKYPNKIALVYDGPRNEGQSHVYRVGTANHSKRDAVNIFMGRCVDAGLTGCVEAYDYGNGWEPVAVVSKRRIV